MSWWSISSEILKYIGMIALVSAGTLSYIFYRTVKKDKDSQE